MEQIAVISIICRSDKKEAAKITGKLDLNENELAILMGVPKKEKIISEIMNNSQKFRQQREVVTIDYKPTFDKKEDEEENKKIVAKPEVTPSHLYCIVYDSQPYILLIQIRKVPCLGVLSNDTCLEILAQGIYSNHQHILLLLDYLQET